MTMRIAEILATLDEAFSALTELKAMVSGLSPADIPDKTAAEEAPLAESYPITRDALEEWAFGRGLEKPTWKTLAMSCGFKAGTKHLSPDELYIFAKAIDNHLKKVGK